MDKQKENKHKNAGRPTKYGRRKVCRIEGRVTERAKRFFRRLGGFDWLERMAALEEQDP